MTVPASSSRYPWLVVLMLWAISCFNYADRQAIFSVFSVLEKEFGLSTVELGLLGSSFAWAYGLSGPLAGMAVDRMKRKTAILTGLQVWSFICAATATARTFPQLVLFRAAEGLGETMYFPASMSMISDYHGKATRSRAMGFHQTSVYVGTIAGGYFAALLAEKHGWRWSFIVFGGLGMVLGLLLYFFLKEPVRGQADVRDDKVKPISMSEFLGVLRRTPTALLLMGAFLCSNFVAVVLLTWMPKFIGDRFGLSLSAAGLTATLYVQLASMAGSALGGYLADWWRSKSPRGRAGVQCLGVLCGAPFVALCGMSQSVTVLIVALTFWGLFKGLYDANIWASLFDVIRPEARGTAVGTMNMMGWLAGGGTAPIVIGWVASGAGLGPAIALASGVYVLAAIFLLVAIFLYIEKDVQKVAG